MRYLAAATAIVLLIVIVIFSIQNLEIVDVTFLTLAVSVPKFAVVLASYVLGMVTGGSVVAIIKRAQVIKHRTDKVK